MLHATVVVVKLTAFFHGVVDSCHRLTVAVVGIQLRVGIRYSLVVGSSLAEGMVPPNVQTFVQVKKPLQAGLRHLLSLTLTCVGLCLETP